MNFDVFWEKSVRGKPLKKFKNSHNTYNITH